MANLGWPLSGAGTRWEACQRLLLEGALSPAHWWWLAGGGQLPESLEEAGERRDSHCTQRWNPWLLPPLPIPPMQPSEPGRATLAEAKFTFLCGAWGHVQSLGSTEPGIVVMGRPH